MYDYIYTSPPMTTDVLTYSTQTRNIGQSYLHTKRFAVLASSGI